MILRVAMMGYVGMILAAEASFSQEELRTYESTDTVKFDAVSVHSLRIPLTSSEASGNIQILETNQLQNGSSPDIADALNSLPGVQMSTRGDGGSRKLQIRGSGLRSPFGVRNVDMVMDGFVLTNASGNSPLELWNPQWINRMEVLKGPGGAFYGSGYGGVLIGYSLSPFDQMTRNQVSAQGYSRLSSCGSAANRFGNDLNVESGFSMSHQKNHSRTTFTGWWADNPGFRDQESNHKKQMEAHHEWTSKGREIKHHIWAGALHAYWELPGSINENDSKERPTTAPGGPFDAHVDRDRTWFAYSQQKTTDLISSGIWVYTQDAGKKNPYGTSAFYNGIKTESESFMSIRGWRSKSKIIGQEAVLTWDYSGIIRMERLHLIETDWYPSAADQRYAIHSDAVNAWAASSGQLKIRDWRFIAQGAIEGMQRESDGSSRASNETTYTYSEAYQNLQFHPFVSISKKIRPHTRAFLSFATASSQPTSFELIDPLTFVSSNLNAEFAKNLEIGIKGGREISNATRLTWSMQAYNQQVSDAIAAVVGPNDGIYLGNIDGLSMSGLECWTEGNYIVNPGVQFHWKSWLNLSRNHMIPDTDRVPGTPLHSAGMMAHLTHHKWEWGVQYYWNDRMPLHDSKNDWSSAWHRVDISLAHRTPKQTWQFFVRNATNTSYSNWLQTNAFGGKYFNPAPGRSAGFSWQWMLNQ